MDRDKLNQVLSRQFDDPSDVEVVDLPSLDAKLTLGHMPREHRREAQTYALIGQDKGERVARSNTAAVRWSALDDDGQLLFSSYDEAIRFLATIEDDEFWEVLGALNKLRSSRDEQVESVEEGKGS